MHYSFSELLIITITVCILFILFMYRMKFKHIERIKYLLIIPFAFIVLLILGNFYKSPEDIACTNDWKACNNNGHFTDNYSGTITIKEKCKEAAISKAKFGNPIFSTTAFEWFANEGSTREGKDFVEKGVLHALDKRAQFQNEYGAAQNVLFDCIYDLESNQVLDLFIIE